MILQFLAPIGAFLKRVPWQVWAIAAIVFVAWQWGNHRYSQGVAYMQPKLELEQANHAITLNSLNQLERRLSDMIEAGKLTRERVERAIETGGNESAALREQAEEARGAIVIDGRTPKAILESGI